MRSKTILFTILIILFYAGCTKPVDPVDDFVKYMIKRLAILEKHKDNPAEAAAALLKYNSDKAEETIDLSNTLKRSHKLYATEEQQAIVMEKIKPIMDRMIQLLNDNPALVLDESIAKAFEAFDLGF